MNKILLTGRLCVVPQLNGEQGNEWTSNSIAVRREYKNKQGEYESDFISITLFKSQAIFLTKFCAKGDLIEIVGKWRHEKRTDQQGNTKYSDVCIVESVARLSSKEAPKAEEPKEEKPTYTTYDDGDLPF